MFDATLRQRWQQDGKQWRFDMPSGWMQGRTVFGGLTVAAAAALARQHEGGRALALRTVSAQLLSPVTPGPIDGSFRVLRAGKSTCFTEVRLNEESVVVSMVFTKPREDSIVVAPSFEWDAPPPETLIDLPYLEGITPEFTQNVSMRWGSGGVPFSGAQQAKFEGYCRFRVPAGDTEGIIGLLDVWPCPTLSVLQKPTHSSTVMWTAHILSVPNRFDQWFRYAYQTIAGNDGFHTAVGHLFTEDGQRVAWSEQLVAVFD